MQDRNLHMLAGLAAGLVLGATLAGYALGPPAAQAATYDTFNYSGCDWIVPKGLKTSVPELEQWKEMTTTPGGNWCIKLR